MKRVYASGTLLLAVCIVASLPLAAQNDLDQKIDSNIQDWVGSCTRPKTRF